MSKHEEQITPYAVQYATWVLSECKSAARYMARYGVLPEAISTRAYARIVNDSAWFNRMVREEQKARV